MSTVKSEFVNPDMLHNYFHALVGRFFKILPIKESNEDTLRTYMESLQMELLGFKSLMDLIQNDQRLLSLISTLQYLIDEPDCDVSVVKREVFRAIRICEALSSDYGLVARNKGGASNEPLGDL